MNMKVEAPNITEDRNYLMVSSFEAITCLFGYCWHQLNSRFTHEMQTIFGLLVSFNWTKLVQNFHIFFFINFQGFFLLRNSTLAFKNILISIFLLQHRLFSRGGHIPWETQKSFVFALLALLLQCKCFTVRLTTQKQS